MAYDEGLAERIRELAAGEPGWAERRMFGGLGGLIDGNMAVGVLGDGLVVRVGPDSYEAALRRPGARVFDITGRAMSGWVVVGPEGLTEDDVFAEWVRAGVAFARALPPKG